MEACLSSAAEVFDPPRPIFFPQVRFQQFYMLFSFTESNSCFYVRNNLVNRSIKEALFFGNFFKGGPS